MLIPSTIDSFPFIKAVGCLLGTSKEFHSQSVVLLPVDAAHFAQGSSKPWAQKDGLGTVGMLTQDVVTSDDGDDK